MRLFIAVDLPGPVLEELSRIQSLLPEEKLSLAKNFHLTLKFLGEVTQDKAEWVRAELRKAGFRRFSASLSDLGVFPSEKNMRVVWVGVSPEKGFLDLHRSVDDCIGSEYPDDHGFSPHITLARAKYISDRAHFLEVMKRISVNRLEFQVGSFSLKQSILQAAKGPVYRDVEVFGADD
ncbi:RNA 2',3'-cyclic phosphodiesterase [Candidatus Woesearchaeota archaeon]|nr:RNA 2',3'-cyclic phosphodiesterase [Candidatus Woesearchaeota archaeon]